MAWEQKMEETLQNEMEKAYKHYEEERIQKAMEKERVEPSHRLVVSNYLQRYLHGDTRYDDRLNRYEFQVYSQNGEDGILHAILNRIGEGGRRFFEIGVSDGLECNTAFLLLQGWSGTWVECEDAYCKYIPMKFKDAMSRLNVVKEFVTAENVNDVVGDDGDVDVLSIDIDGNDYWVWNALQTQPRVVVIEYNAMFPPTVDWVMPYNPDYRWNGSMCSGASLLALTRLAWEKGYRLVACDFVGVNAFYVQEKFVKRMFWQGNLGKSWRKLVFGSPEINTAWFYEKPKYFLCTRFGHPRDFYGSGQVEARFKGKPLNSGNDID